MAVVTTALEAAIAPAAVVRAAELAESTETTQLRDWSYNPASGRLEVNAGGAIRPELFTLDNPSRVVVDFPKVIWGQPERIERYRGDRVQALRISQFNPDTTRIVLDIDPDRPISPAELQLLTASPERWAVQLARSPQQNVSPVAAAAPPQTELLPPLPTSGTASPAIASSSEPQLVAQTGDREVDIHISAIESTPEGFLIRTNGPVEVTTRRLFDPDRIAVDFFGADVSQMEGPKELSVNRLGVSTLRAGQFLPTVARIALDVDVTSGDWESVYDAARGGVILYPAGGAQGATLVANTPANFDGPRATLRSVQLQGNRLVIDADGFMFYRSGWDPSSRAYRISVSPAVLPEALPDPGLSANSPVERIRFVQENATTVSILVQPSRDFNVFEPFPGQGSRRITLDLLGIGQTAPPPVAQSVPLPAPTAAPTPQLPSRRPRATIALDAGHGGADPGAIGVGGIREKEVNLDITQRVQRLLLERGFNVVMTRTDDRKILLQPRIDRAVAGGAAILVSIHTNALNRSNISGAETYYLRPDSARLAQVMHRNVVQGTGAVNRNVRRARFFMVRETPITMPSVLLELGYLTNPTEASRLRTAEYRERVAQAIARGIAEYFGN
ncbi:N-acetylmuramoyl-L-alanine amidase [Synechococcus sp. PCC 7336]|uniref:N-acetylmuramoyl-L-alanine amidase n=1 Tax=Synechococcus sp. PCC 7336 TaxID=195250 RepID=UPI0003621F24|nr:N-acetylmuramoyl-L-alanine amidase [Synechococcus sp. PCC 7336]